jgi:hypothetical protein
MRLQRLKTKKSSFITWSFHNPEMLYSLHSLKIGSPYFTSPHWTIFNSIAYPDSFDADPDPDQPLKKNGFRSDLWKKPDPDPALYKYLLKIWPIKRIYELKS